jgi:hypothetical protein
VTVPLYSSSVLIFTIFAGSLFFGEASQMRSVSAFALGTTITLGGLFVLGREKGRQEQLDKVLAAKDEKGSRTTDALLTAEATET